MPSWEMEGGMRTLKLLVCFSGLDGKAAILALGYVIAEPNLSQSVFMALLWRLSKMRSISDIYELIGEKNIFSTPALCSTCVPDAEPEQGYFISPPAPPALQLDLSQPQKLRAKCRH